MFKILQENRLYLQERKCEFFRTQVRFLGHVVSQQGIQVDPEKVRAIKEFPRPTNLKELISFLGMANFYRKFIWSYSRKAAALSNLLQKDEMFKWSNEQEEAFLDLKESLMQAPVLQVADADKPFVIHTDASVGL